MSTRNKRYVVRVDGKYVEDFIYVAWSRSPKIDEDDLTDCLDDAFVFMEGEDEDVLDEIKWSNCFTEDVEVEIIEVRVRLEVV